jgi:hypothetical protein
MLSAKRIVSDMTCTATSQTRIGGVVEESPEKVVGKV